jgi:WD40 repeat protein
MQALNTESWSLDSQISLAGSRFFRNTCFSPTGQLLANSQTRESVSIFDVSSKKEIASLPTYANSNGPLTFSRDGKLLVIMGENGLIHVWNLSTLRQGLREISLDWQPEEPLDLVDEPFDSGGQKLELVIEHKISRFRCAFSLRQI